MFGLASQYNNQPSSPHSSQPKTLLNPKPATTKGRENQQLRGCRIDRNRSKSMLVFQVCCGLSLLLCFFCHFPSLFDQAALEPPSTHTHKASSPSIHTSEPRPSLLPTDLPPTPITHPRPPPPSPSAHHHQLREEPRRQLLQRLAAQDQHLRPQEIDGVGALMFVYVWIGYIDRSVGQLILKNQYRHTTKIHQQISTAAWSLITYIYYRSNRSTHHLRERLGVGEVAAGQRHGRVQGLACCVVGWVGSI